MQLLKPFVLVSTALFAGLALAQPPAAPVKESSIQAIIRMRAEGRTRALAELRKEMSKFNIIDADQNTVLDIIFEQDAQRELIRRAYYELGVAEDAGVADDQYLLFWQDFQKLSEDHRATRARDSKIIADKLRLGQNPRLSAYLTFRGIIGDEIPFLKLVSETAHDAFSLKFDIERAMKQPKRVVTPPEEKPVPAPQ